MCTFGIGKEKYTLKIYFSRYFRMNSACCNFKQKHNNLYFDNVSIKLDNFQTERDTSNSFFSIVSYF